MNSLQELWDKSFLKNSDLFYYRELVYPNAFIILGNVFHIEISYGKN